MGNSNPIRTLRMVRVAGFEPTASWSRTKRATNCATPGYFFKVFAKQDGGEEKWAGRKPAHFIWRRHPDLNWGIRILQTLALPLGYGAIHCYSIVSLSKLERQEKTFLNFLHRMEN